MSTTLGARTALGVLTGAIGLVAMLRLVAGAFTGGMSGFALGVTLVAMVPWVAYVTWRARRSRLTPRRALIALGLDVLALALVFVLVFGPVLALALSFAAFVLLWIGDRPVRERPLGETWVRVEELRRPDPEASDEPDEPDDPSGRRSG
ncbi:hypothetical protein SAMN04488544_1974 [Microlunatus sagamiharensis]|uniref:Uncharacterized protein n=1 Tax=Microlunatus sagamiharensis TaxID=546874 RepID=A0A1H2MG00_9ACTN|nr:hypothetical protein [Microlunatus sagamiharensis]SDU91965.1 hypothetical protein SAMN04488544_1974 [Microlunatus sagamiharensis]